MATAEELLAAMSVSNDDALIVINPDRSITIPDILKPIAVQFDHNIETVTFDCPRLWDSHDFSKMRIYINYRTPNGETGRKQATNVRIVDGEGFRINFDWTISRNITQVKGKLTFLVCIYNIDDEGTETLHWNSRLNSDMEILEGLEVDSTEYVEQNPDVIEDILLRLDVLEALGGIDSDMPLPADAMSANVYDPQGKQTDIFKYVDDKVAESGGNSGESTGGTTEEDSKPTIISIHVARETDTVTFTYNMNDETISSDIITLDTDGYPTNINVDGTDIPITHTGFIEEVISE